jgi:hypothetical protein
MKMTKDWMNKNQNSANILAASFRDPNGFLFERDGKIFRQVNAHYESHYRHLMESGLYETLVSKKLLITHEEVEVSPNQPVGAHRVLAPRQLKFISYPYEWCFSQLKDAALATLRIQRLAIKHGMWLKDSSAYNIQFLDGKPVLIDTLSFEKYPEGQPWVAYRQFCQHFLAPLALMTYSDVRLSRLMQLYIDGVPLDLASKLLPRKTRFNLFLSLHIHIHARAQTRYADKEVSSSANARQMTKNGLMGLIDSLTRGVKKLTWESVNTEWGDYYDKLDHYAIAAFEHKKNLVNDFISKVEPRTVWDLGANEGVFSRTASQRNLPTVAWDIDPVAVEKNYLRCKTEKDENLVPLVNDLTNPSPGIGWAHSERMSMVARGPVDLVMALALIHHLAISNNVPLPKLASFFASLAPWLIIEFVPKEDSQVQILLNSREDIFPNYHQSGFETAFADHFEISSTVPIEQTGRILYLLKRTQ